MSSALASVLAPESPRKPRASGIFCFQSLGYLRKLALLNGNAFFGFCPKP